MSKINDTFRTIDYQGTFEESLDAEICKSAIPSWQEYLGSCPGHNNTLNNVLADLWEERLRAFQVGYKLGFILGRRKADSPVKTKGDE